MSGQKTMKRIEAMSEPELDATLRAQGVDPDQITRDVFQKVCVLAGALQKKLEQEQGKRLKTDLALMLSDSVLPPEFKPDLPPTIRLHEFINRQRERLETYTDCFEQLGVASLAELVERHDGRVERLEAERDQLQQSLRREWWHNHGCAPDTRFLYGDDGEMQCSKCHIDFQRMEFEELEKQVDGLRWAAIARAQKENGS